MSLTVVIYTVALLIAVAGSVVAIKSSLTKGKPRNRGTEPGQGDVLNDSGTGASAGNVPVTRVTRDPQEYAKAMAPKAFRD